MASSESATLGALLAESRELETIGSGIQQKRDVGLSSLEIDAFIDQYHGWLARCLGALPLDLQERFRAEYAGNWLTSKIKTFLEAPTQSSPLYQEDQSSELFSYWQNPFDTAFRAPLLAQRQILMEAEHRAQAQSPQVSSIALVERLCRRFPDFLRPITTRRHNRPPFLVESEYDVQDVLHGLLKIFFEDVRAEEMAPSHAGAASRVDFLLKPEELVLEIKLTRSGRGAKDIGDELLADIGRYHAHPACRTLIAFVYDPTRQVANPRGLERDLTGRHEGLDVRVVVVQA